MSLDTLIKTAQVFTTTDGKQHADRDAALAHQMMLNNAAHIEKVVNSFANVISAPGSKEVGLVGRTRVFNLNVASQFLSFLLSKGVVDTAILEAFEAIEPSEELAVRMEEEAVKAAALAAAKAKKDDENKKAAEATAPVAEEAPADMFN